MQQRAINTRNAILAAARAEFAAKGYHGARVDAISKQAGVNKQRIYANFHDKAGLFKAVLRMAFVELAEEESRFTALTKADIPHLADHILETYARIHARHPEFWRLLAWENLGGGRHSAAVVGHQNEVLGHLRHLYTQGQKSGHFLQEVPFEGFLFNLLAVSFFMVSNRATLKRSIGLDCSRPATRQALRDAVVRQLRATRPRRRSNES